MVVVIVSTIDQSSTPKKVATQIYLLEKYTLNIEPPITIKEPPRFLRLYPCTDKKWNSLFHLTSPATGYPLSTSIEYDLSYEAVGNAYSVTHNMT